MRTTGGIITVKLSIIARKACVGLNPTPLKTLVLYIPSNLPTTC
ncbi:hypothetical protein [Vulcanisaeta sp. EB80]|nr:hypothetical protein [Vulcanisaeta sp. EB80]